MYCNINIKNCINAETFTLSFYLDREQSEVVDELIHLDSKPGNWKTI